MQALHYLLPLIFLIGSLKAENVQSMQEGDFFNPLVWSNQEVPDLTSDSIFINHNLSYNQEFVLSGTEYLFINNCVNFCGKFNFTVDSGAFVRIEGILYAGGLTVRGIVKNNGFFHTTQFFIIGGLFSNFENLCGTGALRPYEQDCTGKGVVSDTIFEYVILQNLLFINSEACKCSKRVDFGDGNIVEYDTGSTSHTYTAAGIYTFIEYTYCPCDTFIVERTIKIDSICDIISDLVIFPNPGNGAYKLRYTYCKSGTYNAQLCNNIGQLIRYITIEANKELPFDMLGMAPGVYFIVPPTSSGVKPKRFVHF